jgi:thiol-disulfide isomerase/thioredoxin
VVDDFEEPEERERGQRPDRPRPPAIYSVVVGLIFVAVIAIAGISALRAGDDREVLGSEEDSSLPLAQFAVPDARSDLDGDANIAQDDCESSLIPCPGDEVRTPACEVDLEGAIRVCDLFDKPLVLSFWFTRGGECEAQQDEFEAVYREYSDRVNFLGINARDDRDAVLELAEDRGWTHPIGLDSDGALSNLYRVGGCPTTVYAFPGGILEQTSLGELSAEELAKRVDELIAASEKRANTVR